MSKRSTPATARLGTMTFSNAAFTSSDLPGWHLDSEADDDHGRVLLRSFA